MWYRPRPSWWVWRPSVGLLPRSADHQAVPSSTNQASRPLKVSDETSVSLAAVPLVVLSAILSLLTNQHWRNQVQNWVTSFFNSHCKGQSSDKKIIISIWHTSVKEPSYTHIHVHVLQCSFKTEFSCEMHDATPFLPFAGLRVELQFYGTEKLIAHLGIGWKVCWETGERSVLDRVRK